MTNTTIRLKIVIDLKFVIGNNRFLFVIFVIFTRASVPLP
jgi:hypothetical protein